GRVELEVEPTFEHGLLVDAGSPRFQGVQVPTDRLAVAPVGPSRLLIEAGDTALRAVVIGGEPLDEELVMWWNFIGRDHDEIVAFREQWQRDVIDGGTRDGRFGRVEGYPGAPLPAPALPGVRLRPRAPNPTPPNPVS